MSKQETKADIKDIVIEKATEIFSKFGFNKTTMDEIAYAVGKGKSSLYYYFYSKEEIYHAVIENESNILLNEIHKHLKTVSDPKEKLRLYMIIRTNSIKRLASFYYMAKDKYYENYNLIEKMRKDHDEKELNIIVNILKEGVEKNIFQIKDCKLMAEAIFIAEKGFEHLWAFEQLIDDTTDRINMLFDVLCFGIVKR
jgi:AcrR family transcriptional regulator